MISFKHAEEEAEPEMALGVSPERLGRDAGGSLVPPDYPRHDAARIPDLQGVPRVPRENRNEHTGRPFAQARSSWNYHHQTRSIGRAQADLPAHAERNRSGAGAHRNGPLVGCARRCWQPGARPNDTKRQRKISSCHQKWLDAKKTILIRIFRAWCVEDASKNHIFF